MEKTVFRRMFLVLPAAIFWTIICFIPHGPGENYVHLLSWESAGLLSTIFAISSLYFAVRAKRDGIWWLISAINLSPLAWFLIAPYCYLFLTQPYD